MTNAESILESAVAAMNAGKLNSYESELVAKFQGYNKKQLKALTSKQYKVLRAIAHQNTPSQ